MSISLLLLSMKSVMCVCVCTVVNESIFVFCFVLFYLFQICCRNAHRQTNKCLIRLVRCCEIR